MPPPETFPAPAASETQDRKCARCCYWERLSTQAGFPLEIGVCRHSPPPATVIQQSLIVPAIAGNLEIVDTPIYEILPGPERVVLKAGTLAVIPPPMRSNGYCRQFSPGTAIR